MVVIAKQDEQVHVYEGGHWRPAHLEVRQYANGERSEPESWEIDRWREWVSKPRALPESTGDMVIEQQTDLLNLIDQYPHCLIWGGTGGGKTSLLRLIAHRRKLQGHQVLVLDSREHPVKWVGLDRMETEGKINKAILGLFNILRQNVEALRTGRAIEDDFTKITVITDEWTEIVTDNDIARQFISEMVRQSRKYGISLAFATQTNLASDLGLDGRYKTISGFLQLHLQKRPDNVYVALASTGNQKLGEFVVPEPPIVPHLLPTGYVAPSLESVKVEPTDEEQKVLDMLAGGESYRFISYEMWKQTGRFYNQRIEAIAKKWPDRVGSGNR